MSVTVKIKYEPMDETKSVTSNFPDWIATLTSAEQQEFKLAQHEIGKKQHLLEYQGKLTVTHTPELTYAWATNADADIGLPTVANWDKYHNRYLAENNAKVTTVRT
jgi:hypothetical protein